MRHLIQPLVWLLAALCLFPALAQFPDRTEPQTPQRVIPPSVPLAVPSPPAQHALAPQREEYDKRQECLDTHQADYHLYAASRQLITVRDNRKVVEYELASNPARQQQFPQGYDQVLAEAFARYRAAGGTADNPRQVIPLTDPCAPAPRAGTGARSGVINQTRSTPAVAR
jgi:hypothetical protein